MHVKAELSTLMFMRRPFIFLALIPALVLAYLPEASAAAAPAKKEAEVKAAPDEKARSELIYRASLGRADDIRFLIKEGGSPNQVSGEGVPVICLAAGRIDSEGVEVVHALLEAGANINARDAKGQNALFYAAKAGNIDTIYYLMDNNIDLYALDNNGEVARSAAFKAGRTDSVKAMDDYVVRQTEEVTSEYKEKNKELAAIYAGTVNGVVPPKKTTPPKPAPVPVPEPKPAPEAKPTPAPKAPEESKAPEEPVAGIEPIEEAPAEAAPDEAPPVEAAPESGEAPAESATPAPEESAVPPEESPAPVEPAPESVAPEDAIAAPDAAPPAPPAPVDPKVEQQQKKEQRQEIISGLIYDMSFNVCAFQYWSYCQSVGQSVDMDHEEHVVAIESSKTKAQETKKQLIREYKLKTQMIQSITDSAQRRIYNTLNGMASNRDRHEKGIGKRDDMQMRCEEIARQWGVKAKLNPVTEEKSNGKGGGGAGKGGSGKGGGGKSKGGAPKTAGAGKSKSKGFKRK